MNRYEGIAMRTALWLALCFGCVALPNRMPAQAAPRDTLKRLDGSRVRLEIDGHGQRIGTLLDARRDSLFLYACGHCKPFRFAAGEIDRIDVSRGWSEGRVYRDFVLGFLAGGVSGYVLGNRADRNCGDYCGLAPALDTVGGAIIGMIAGGVIGSRDHWVRAWP